MKCRCGADSATAYLCKPCGQDLAGHLRHLPWLDEQVKITARGGARLGEPDGSGFRKHKKEIPLPPYRADADRLAYDARQIVTRWAQITAAGAHVDLRNTPPGAACGWSDCRHITCIIIRAASTWSTAALARFTAAHIDALRHHPEADTAHAALADLHEQMLRKINRPEPMWYAGACDQCGRDLYVRPGAQTATCQTIGCGTTYDVKTRREDLLNGIEDHLATATTIARALTSLGEPLTEDRIYLWKSRGRLVPHGWDTPVLSYDSAGRRKTRQVALFRIGEIRKLLAADLERRQNRGKKSAA